MNYYKTKVRNRMSLNTINSLIHIKYGLRMKNSCCENYSIPPNVCAKINSNENSKYHRQTMLWPEDEENMTESTFFLEVEQFNYF